MLPTNFTRSASSEALPSHRLFSAKSGLTSRFPVWKRYLLEKAYEAAANHFGKAKCV
jgi:hypothetical protein